MEFNKALELRQSKKESFSMLEESLKCSTGCATVLGTAKTMSIELRLALHRCCSYSVLF